jgi:FAD synthase
LFDKIRENRKFKSVKNLKEQIRIDIATIKNLKDYVLTFGTFDVIHPGHIFFLQKAKNF